MRILKGAVLSLLIGIACLGAFALFMARAEYPAQHIGFAVAAAYAAGALAGGLYISAGAKSKGMLLGMLSGIVYALAIFAAKSAASNALALDAGIIRAAAVCTIAGAAGGIVGRNLQN
jgi:putative membrane protein (TIGR04086 family)